MPPDGPTCRPTAARPAAAVGHQHKLLVILLENHSGAEAMRSMPNLRRWAHRFGQAIDYHAITHPSLPNYLAIWGGSTFGVTSDCSVGARGCRPAAPSVFARTIDAGRTARAYEQSMTRRCQSATAGRYAARHGPWPYWLGSHERRLCRANDLPAGTATSGAFAHDVATGRLPVTGELTPDFCNDGHDCPLSTADRWLGRGCQGAFGPGLAPRPADDRDHLRRGRRQRGEPGRVRRARSAPVARRGAPCGQPLRADPLAGGERAAAAVRHAAGAVDLRRAFGL